MLGDTAWSAPSVKAVWAGVWHARDELLGRDVAVKGVTPEGLTRTELGDLRERAIREARAIAQIDHPSVVRIFDVVDDGDTPWIVMELIPSRSLWEAIDQDGPMTPEESARIGLAVLASLRAAHRVGILHREVKPANVLLTSAGRVVLTDFGLATLAGDSSMTRTGVVLGSPSYLAPERALTSLPMRRPTCGRSARRCSPRSRAVRHMTGPPRWRPCPR
ncbi:serine/threonine-protein kinase [Micromonospora tarapacensis]|uniref:serine/threonine-protein kinase n=1 Tax=Micromonospora tarapacensis TaxID=2835305 RepID=UPI001E5694C3|nr:serine/threonine-protein kinase [Micromonospora tarapacensis]